MESVRIERATEKDHIKLTEITVDGKAFWGFSKEQLAIWKDDLTVSRDYISANETYNLFLDSSIIGYYSFLKMSDDQIILDNLFLFQKYIGQGFGTLLMNDFLERVKKSGFSTIILEAEPNAEDFYKKFGFSTYGLVESKIKGRLLPKMKLNLIS